MTEFATAPAPPLGQTAPTTTVTLGASSTVIAGTLIDDRGVPQVGAVSFRPVIIDASGHLVAAGTPVTTPLTPTGRYALRVFCTDDPATTAGVVYLVSEPVGACYVLSVPATSSGIIGLRHSPGRGRPTAA